MFLVGLTGGVAAGKSSTAKIFSELGVPVIDADAIAREVSTYFCAICISGAVFT